MKTTNFENSKKLAEIGFKADTKNWWMLSSFNEPTHQLKTYNRFEDYVGDNYRAYDLETILEALPKNYLIRSDWLECFQNGNFNGTKRLENESLVDTAARLLIALAEKKIINFK